MSNLWELTNRELMALAQREGVAFETDDNKADLVWKIERGRGVERRPEMAKKEGGVALGEYFTLKDDQPRTELPDGGWIEPGRSYVVTYDKMEFVNKLIAEGKAEPGMLTPDGGQTNRTGPDLKQFRKDKEEAKAPGEDDKWADDPANPDVRREARNDRGKAARGPEPVTSRR